jgi:elongation factor G
MGRGEELSVRNICFVGHSGCGKTSLAEALLFAAGATTRKGSTADGTSILDFEEEEKQKKMTIKGATAFLKWKDTVIHLIDLPGYLDFIGEIICGMSAVETAFLCVDLASGVKVTTRKAWDFAQQYGLGRVLVLTKIDQNPEDIEKMIQEIIKTFGDSVVPFFTLENGKAVSLLPYLLSSENKTLQEKTIPVLEKIIETDEVLMEKYLNGEPPNAVELTKALQKAIISQQLSPLILCSAEKDVGIKELLDFIVDACPPADCPQQKTALKGEEKVKVVFSADKPFLAQVFKIMTDPYVGKLAYFRVYAGSIGVGQSFVNPRTNKTERVGSLYKIMGKDQKPVEKLSAGELGAVSKIEDISIGDSMCAVDEPLVFERIKFPEPMVMYALTPKSRSDEEKISGALSKLSDEDPTFNAKWDTETGESVVRGNSTLHLDMMIKKMRRRFGLEVEMKLPKIPYRETVLAKAEGHYKHKKQTGGRGQFGEVYLRIEPLPRDGGFEFVDAIVGGAIPRQFIPSVEKGVQKAIKKGVLAGYPVQDVRVTVFDGSYHTVDSDDLSFRIAGERAFYDGLEKAKPVLLEPVVDIEIVAPPKYMGDITSDLNARRARITGMDQVGDYQTIKAKVPLAEVMTYSTQLRSITGGEGSFTMAFSHYDVLPANIAQQVIERAKREKTETK